MILRILSMVAGEGDWLSHMEYLYELRLWGNIPEWKSLMGV